MDYNAPKCALTECQLGRMHWSLIGHDGNIGDCLIKDYLDYDVNKSITISDGSSNTWEFDQYINGDLVVENNSSLTIKCNTFLSIDGSISIEGGSTLVIDGGTIYNADINTDIGGTLEVINDGNLILESGDIISISSGGIFHFNEGTIE